MLHTLYGQAVKHDWQFLMEWFVPNLTTDGKKRIGLTTVDT